MSFAEPLPKESRPGRRLRLSGRFTWPVGFAILAVVVFIYYYLDILGYLVPSLQDVTQHWFPLVSINEALVWAIAALGLNIVVGYAGLLDLGFVAFWAIGGYVAGWLMSGFAGESLHLNFKLLGNPARFITGGIHINFWLVLIAGAAVCALFGVLIGAPTLRLRSDYLALVTLGFGEIIPQIFYNGEHVGSLNLSNGTKGINPVDQIQFLSVGPQGVGFKSLGPFDQIGRASCRERV